MDGSLSNNQMRYCHYHEDNLFLRCQLVGLSGAASGSQAACPVPCPSWQDSMSTPPTSRQPGAQQPLWNSLEPQWDAHLNQRATHRSVPAPPKESPDSNNSKLSKVDAPSGKSGNLCHPVPYRKKGDFESAQCFPEMDKTLEQHS